MTAPNDVRATCRDLAARIRTNKTTRASDSTWDGVGFEERNYKGLLGAWAVGAFLGVQFDDAIHPGPDDGHDVLFHDVRIEVKTLQALLAVPQKNIPKLRAAMIALVNYRRHEPEAMMFVGWLSRVRFMERHFLIDFGYGPSLCVSGDDLLEPWKLAFCHVPEPKRVERELLDTDIRW